MENREPSGFPRQINAVIARFLDGELSFDPAVAELTPLIRAWVERPKTVEEKARELANNEKWLRPAPDRTKIVAHDHFPIAEGRSADERERAEKLVMAAMERYFGSPNSAA